jgi:hypothetical protein
MATPGDRVREDSRHIATGGQGKIRCSVDAVDAQRDSQLGNRRAETAAGESTSQVSTTS